MANINTHIQQICDECPRFNSPEWQRKSESRMESNLLKTDCLKEEREVVFPKAKKKKTCPALQFFQGCRLSHCTRQEIATKVNHQESVKKKLN